MMTLSQKAQSQLSDINKVITVLFPQFKTLSQYCLALGYSEAQLKAMSPEQIENFIGTLDGFLSSINAIERARRNADAIAKAGADLEQSKAAYSQAGDRFHTSHTSHGDMVRVNWHGEAQDKMDAATKDNLALKNELQSFTLSHLVGVIGEPADR